VAIISGLLFVALYVVVRRKQTISRVQQERLLKQLGSSKTKQNDAPSIATTKDTDNVNV